MFPEAKPRGTLRVEGKQNSLFPEGPVIKCLLFLRDLDEGLRETKLTVFPLGPVSKCLM